MKIHWQVLEVGPLDNPVKLQWRARYVDVVPLPDLQAMYPTALRIARPDLLDSIGTSTRGTTPHLPSVCMHPFAAYLLPVHLRCS